VRCSTGSGRCPAERVTRCVRLKNRRIVARWLAGVCKITPPKANQSSLTPTNSFSNAFVVFRRVLQTESCCSLQGIGYNVGDTQVQNGNLGLGGHNVLVFAHLYQQRSPLAYVGNVKTPTLMIATENDLRTPPAQAEEFFHALKMRKVPTAYILFNEEWYGFHVKPSNYLRWRMYLKSWFDNYTTKD